MKDSPATDSSFYYRYERQDTALSVCSAGHEKTCNGYAYDKWYRKNDFYKLGRDSVFL